jgi:hypothetical protein
MRLPKYKQHEKMGEGDPLKMAGLPMQPKRPGNLSKTPRNKLLKDLRPTKRYWEIHGRPRVD